MGKASDALPEASELAAIYLADDDMTIERLASRFGISYNAIRPTLNEGLALLGTNAAEVRADRRDRRGEHRPRHFVRADRCNNCDLLLTNGRCQYCQPEPGRLDYITFMSTTFYEGL